MNPPRRTSAPRGARAGVALLGAGAIAAVSLAAAPAAYADTDYLQISHDGTSFSGSASQPIFPAGLRLVPGAAETGSLWVRNNTAEPAYLSLAVTGSGIAPGLAGNLEFRSRISAGAESAVLPGNGTCSDLGTPVLLPAGAAGRVDFSAGLVPEAPNTTMDQQASFDVLLLLDAAVGRSACAVPPILEQQVPAPGTQDVRLAGTALGRPGAAAVAIPGTGAQVTLPANAQVPVNAPAAGVAEAAGIPGLPPQITPASFIESTVEPIIRTWQGTLLVLLTAGFFAAAAARIRITRRTQ